MELSGSEDFRKSLRRILGFELVDTLLEDLEKALARKQKDLTKVVNSKELTDIQNDIDKIEGILPSQRQRMLALDQEIQAIDGKLEDYEAQLRELPQSRHLQERRAKLEQQKKQKLLSRKESQEQTMKYIGEAGPAVLLFSKAITFEDQLHVKENTGKLPAPYSDQLVEDILHDKVCVCGRPVESGTCEEERIRGLLKNASTTSFNARVRNIQYLLKDIRTAQESYDGVLKGLNRRVQQADTEIADIDDELKEIKARLESIDENSIRRIEQLRSEAKRKYRELTDNYAIISDALTKNEYRLRELTVKYENASKRVGHGNVVKAEIDKIKRLSTYIAKTLKEQERRSLNLLIIQLNKVLGRYLTKHYTARIIEKTYEVDMLDDQGRQVGRSTGEGQVLKFAFITTVVAIAGRKTQEKIEFLAEPTIAPLVLDAPFSALDPEYQGSVAENLANHATQLVLLLSSAGWGDTVAKALESHVGKRYVLISQQKGPRGDKPVKTMTISGQAIALNEYDAKHDDSEIRELA